MEPWYLKVYNNTKYMIVHDQKVTTDAFECCGLSGG